MGCCLFVQGLIINRGVTVCSNFFSFVSRYNFQWLCSLFLLNCLFLQNCAYAVVKNNILKKAFDDNFKEKCRK